MISQHKRCLLCCHAAYYRCLTSELWCRGFVKVAFNLYKVVVLPVANTWMSWNLLHRLQWTASAPVLVSLALLSIFLLTLGMKVS